MTNKVSIFRFADVEVREREFSLIKAGEVLPVEPKAFRVLLILLRNPQKLITKEELLNAVWGDAAVTENSLTRSIALLRRLLGDDIRNPRYIETVATVGYRFLYKVEISEDASGDLDTTGKRMVSARRILSRRPRMGRCGGRGESSGADRHRRRGQGTKREADRREAQQAMEVAAIRALPFSPCAWPSQSGTCAARCRRCE